MKDKYPSFLSCFRKKSVARPPRTAKTSSSLPCQDHSADVQEHLEGVRGTQVFFDKFSIQERNFVEAQFLSLLGRTRVSLAKTITVDVVVGTWKVTRSTRLSSVSIVTMSQPKNFFRVVRGTVQLIAPAGSSAVFDLRRDAFVPGARPRHSGFRDVQGQNRHLFADPLRRF
jgi:hypothetical protein